jgi:eukaryotic-like serine/threonine-protein kinase
MRALPADEGAMTLGDIELVAELGEAASKVYLGRRSGPRRFSRLVALRSVGPFSEEQRELAQAIEDDLRRAAHVSHPSVLPLREVGADGDARYVVTDYVEGGSVADLLDVSGGRLPPGIAVAIALDALAGLEAVHHAEGTKGLVHGRVSSRNLIVGLDGRTRVADLGLGRAPRADRPGEPRASYHFLAPEAQRGVALDARADVFSLGIVLYEALAGHHPLATARTASEASVQLMQPLPLLSTTSASVPSALAEVVARAVAGDPELRHPDARSFASALERSLPRASASEVADFASVHLGPRVEAGRRIARRWIEQRAEHRGEPSSIAARASRRLRLSERQTTAISIVLAALLAVGSVVGIGLLVPDETAPLVLERWTLEVPAAGAPRTAPPVSPPPNGSGTVIVLGDEPTESPAPPTPRPRPRRAPSENLANPYR